ncbi:MAG: sporulation protein YunB [Bacilli bacterium]|nr:sporulation protein YunB [Bacilli bacterium]
MSKIKLKKQITFKPIKKSRLFLISVILIMIVVIILFRFINTKASPLIMNYAELEAKKLSSIIINKAISKHITEKVNSEDMFEITKDNTGEIKSIDFNTTLVNKFLTETTNSIQINLRNIEKGDIDALEFSDSVLTTYDKEDLEKGIIYEVSSGVIIGNPLLANVGPKIPVKINLVGDATSYVSTEVKNYGINSALIEVYVNLKISEKVMLPYYNKNITIETKAPVAFKIVTGTVPKYYSNGLTQQTPSIVVPTEEEQLKDK